MKKYWHCLDCDRLYDLDVDKCIECGSDNWQKISEAKYVEIMEARMRRLKKLFPKHEDCDCSACLGPNY
jgi:hypothetical protein